MESGNFTVFRRDLYSYYELIVLFECIVPALVLCLMILFALIVTKTIIWKMLFILVNIFAVEVLFSLSASITYLGFPLRQAAGDSLFFMCRVQSALLLPSSFSKAGTTMLYAIMVYIFVKNNIKKIKWYMVVIPMTVIWLLCVVFSLGLIARPVDPLVDSESVILEGFCPRDLDIEDYDRVLPLVILPIAWAFQTLVCGGIITFSILTI